MPQRGEGVVPALQALEYLLGGVFLGLRSSDSLQHRLSYCGPSALQSLARGPGSAWWGLLLGGPAGAQAQSRLSRVVDVAAARGSGRRRPMCETRPAPSRRLHGQHLFESAGGCPGRTPAGVGDAPIAGAPSRPPPAGRSGCNQSKHCLIPAIVLKRPFWGNWPCGFWFRSP